MIAQGLDKLKHFVLFCGVGSINTAAALALILLLSEVFEIYYIWANLSGYIFGVILGFFLHRAITFKNASDRNAGKYLRTF